MEHKLKLIFKYDDKEYVIIDENFETESIPPDASDMFWWEEGNGSCDCNRSIFIHKNYPEFEEMDCGHTIELVDWELLDKGTLGVK